MSATGYEVYDIDSGASLHQPFVSMTDAALFGAGLLSMLGWDVRAVKRDETEKV